MRIHLIVRLTETALDSWLGLCRSAGLQDIRVKLAGNVSPGVVVAHDEDFTLLRFAHADAKILARFPDHLCEVAAFENPLGLDAELVLLDLLVPRATHFPRANLRVLVRGPQAVDVLAEIGIRSVREAVLFRQRVGPFLRQSAQRFVQSENMRTLKIDISSTKCTAATAAREPDASACTHCANGEWTP